VIRQHLSYRLLGGIFAALLFAVPHASAAPNLPTLPGPGTGGSPAAAPASADPGALLDRARKGVVLVEREGRPLGAGMVLANDGRIVTSLSALAGSDLADVRYADGHVVKSKVGHRDKAWDLALLLPLSGKWTDGLMASEADPTTIELKLLGPAKGGANAKGALTPVTLKGRTDARSKDGDALNAVLDLDVKGGPTLGTPVLDAAGSVIGLLIHACKPAYPAPAAGDPKGACAQIIVGAPVYALRNFLVKTPVNAVQPAPWLGIVGATDASGNVRGVRVMAVAPQSPAEKGGLKTNPEKNRADLIAAVDGQPVESPEGLAELIGKHAVGEGVKLLVFGGDKFREVTVVLRAAP
jgi:serine protease Do